MKILLVLLAIVVSGVVLTVLENRNNPYAWWIGLATFVVMLLPLFIQFER